jgi:exopolysaccharide biosynthesis polyprenyl glycosylphosphotransferase
VNEDRWLEDRVLLHDVLALLLSLWVADLLRGVVAEFVPLFKPQVPAGQFVHLLLIYVPTWTWGAQRVGLYRLRVLTGPLLELFRALLWAQAWGATAIAVILVAAQVRLNRSLIAMFLVASTGVLLAVKLLQRRWVRRHRGASLAIVIGEEANMATDIERLRGRSAERLDGTDAAALRERLRLGGVDEVVLGSELGPETQHALLEACQEAGIPALVRLERVELDLLRPGAEVVGTALYLTYQRPEPDRFSLLIKAVFDRVAALAAVVLLAPLLLVTAVLVKLTSAGPVFFVQQRGGLNGRPFRMLKFRTMRVGAEQERAGLLAANEMDGPVFKIARDPRVTSFGRFLRRTSIDELPQLLNVAAGHMSLVGPRPLPVIETRGLTGVHRRRLSVRPGLTCLWQISGRNDLPFEQWMALDLQYVDRWSLGLDLAILLRTVPALLGGRGAR